MPSGWIIERLDIFRDRAVSPPAPLHKARYAYILVLKYQARSLRRRPPLKARQNLPKSRHLAGVNATDDRIPVVQDDYGRCLTNTEFTEQIS